MLKHDITGYNVCVILSKEDFLLFDAIDDYFYLKKNDRQDDSIIYKELEKSGAYDIEFNGHFGPHVFFTADSYYQIDRIKNKIEKLLNKYRNKLVWDGKNYVPKKDKHDCVSSS
jgi:hypothetical protein